jgi:hypothetical protein
MMFKITEQTDLQLTATRNDGQSRVERERKREIVFIDKNDFEQVVDLRLR